jgi:hypothetical protein
MRGERVDERGVPGLGETAVTSPASRDIQIAAVVTGSGWI